jgi:hypothetical protein
MTVEPTDDTYFEYDVVNRITLLYENEGEMVLKSLMFLSGTAIRAAPNSEGM